MFTNWLTGTSGSAAANNNSAESSATATTTALSSNISSAATAAAGIMSTPPDVVLEVGPAPGTSVRFVAHSIVLGMHSGYLRSAIRLDENVIAAAASGNATTAAELVLYLGNVTAEQFAPLLTYMYTGYLDLNVENIFGVLLATHVLHMPRALEICRSFLARAQTEGYLGNSLPSIAAAATATNTSKVIRPIPSKATLPNFGFLPTTAPPATLHHAHQLPTTLPATATTAMVAAATAAAENASNNSYKSLQQAYATPMIIGDSREQREEIARNNGDDDDDEDEEVFIDSSSNSETDNEAETEIDCNISVTSNSSVRGAAAAAATTATAKCVNLAAAAARIFSPQKPEKFELLVAEQPMQLREEKRAPTTASISARGSRSNTHAPQNTKKRNVGGGGGERRKQRHKTGAQAASSAGGLQVAKAPIPASQLPDVAEGGPKFIIDVASCDGPVRFRRILNTAYGHKPEAYANAATMPERTQQSVSLSFHQQMAKTISQQRQLQHAEESENSESSGGGGGGGGSGSGGAAGGKSSKTHASNEIYVCVYCKHTFKSQYCYQKHAKRHLNPLSLNCTSTSGSGASGASSSVAAEIREKLESASGRGVSRQSFCLQSTSSLPIVAAASKQQQNATELLLRREVRPLDMNVQYYPCKTCGSKFPSYYFVHKHRKMCHADEEAAAAAVAAATPSTTTATTTEAVSKEAGDGEVDGASGDGLGDNTKPPN